MAPVVSKKIKHQTTAVCEANAEQTPSPHRFLRGDSPTKQPRPTPAPTRQAEFRDGHEANNDQNAAPVQFAATPRFAFKKPKPPTSSRPPSPPKAALLQALRPQKEDVEEDNEDTTTLQHQNHQTNNDDDDDEMLDHPPLPTSVTTPLTLPYSPKRRRLNPSPPPAPSPHRPTFAKPINPPPGQIAPRFKPPPTTTPEQPVPETFSPHRRGHKFVPGGLASMVQQWVVERGRQRGAERVVRVGEVRGILAESVERQGMVFAGTQQQVEKGDEVRLKAPVWSIEVGGREWVVGVDCTVLRRHDETK